VDFSDASKGVEVICPSGKSVAIGEKLSSEQQLLHPPVIASVSEAIQLCDDKGHGLLRRFRSSQ
jgi:hypothetical protein